MIIVNREPLLKEEEEKIVFGAKEEIPKEVNKEPVKKKHNNWRALLDKSVILTIILTIAVFYYFGKTAFGFYLGFKYFNLRYADTSTVETSNPNVINDNTNTLEEVPTSSAILNNTYNKINLNSCNDLLNIVYNTNLNVSNLTLDNLLSLAINNLNNGECITNLSVSVDNLNSVFVNLFNDPNLINNYLVVGDTTYGNYVVNYDQSNNMFNISGITCDTCGEDLVVKQITRATSDDSTLYIYEKFGYLKYSDNNIYEVRDNINGNIITTYTSDGTNSFTNFDILPTYRWTYKKGNDNNYYFESITRM